MNLKVVITGGAGFIGSHIAEYWINQKAEVHIIDNLRSGSLRNLEHLKGIHFHKISITDKDAVFEILKDTSYVHHLAAMVSVPESIQNPRECVELNVIGLLNVLDACIKHSVKKIVHSSSAAVYGDNPHSPKEITMNPLPKSPYGITKLDGEYYLQVYQENFKLSTTSLRYFNVFGPRQDPGSQYAAAIPIFVSKALKDDPIIIYGDGEQTRDFVFVKDVVLINFLAATNLSVSGTFNVGSGHAISVNDIAGLIIKETNSKSKIIYQSERSGDIKHSLASLKETKLKLNYESSFNFIDGLRMTINYFMDIYKEVNS